MPQTREIRFQCECLYWLKEIELVVAASHLLVMSARVWLGKDI